MCFCEHSTFCWVLWRVEDIPWLTTSSNTPHSSASRAHERPIYAGKAASAISEKARNGVLQNRTVRSKGKNLQQKHVTSWSRSCQPTPHQTARAFSQQAVKDAQKSRYSNAHGTCPRRCDRAPLAMRLRETTQSFIMLSTASQAFTSELTLALIFCCCTLAADLSSRSATKGPLAPPMGCLQDCSCWECR